VDEINKNISTYENNLGFFKHAKTKNQIMLDIEDKIEQEKKRIAEIKKKQTIVKDALRKMREQGTVQNQAAG
jgi:hypothetical protein